VKYVTFRKCEHSKKVVVFRASEWTRVFSGTVFFDELQILDLT